MQGTLLVSAMVPRGGMAMRYMAQITIDGKTYLVMPRSKKTGLFDSVDEAVKALESRGRKITRAGAQVLGHVKDTDGNLMGNWAV